MMVIYIILEVLPFEHNSEMERTPKQSLLQFPLTKKFIVEGLAHGAIAQQQCSLARTRGPTFDLPNI